MPKNIGLIGAALLLLSAPAWAFQPVLCSSKGDREWLVDGKTISTQLRAGRAVGKLKDEREVNMGKQWLVQFPGGQAFLTVAGGRYKLVRDDGTVTEGTCVKRGGR